MSVFSRNRTLHGLALCEKVLVDAIRRRRFDELARFISRSKTDFILLGIERVAKDAALPTAALCPSVSAAALASLTHDVGIFVTAVPHLDHPYNLARRLASLDHTSRGRIGWLTGAQDRSIPLGLADRGVWVDGPPSTEVTKDAVQVSRTLWESWPADTILGHPDSPCFADSHRIVHAGQHRVFDIAGPLNVPKPPQQKIPVAWWAQPGDDLDVAARVSDLLVVDEQTLATHGTHLRDETLLFVVDAPHASDVDGHIATVDDLDDELPGRCGDLRASASVVPDHAATVQSRPVSSHTRPAYPRERGSNSDVP